MQENKVEKANRNQQGIPIGHISMQLEMVLLHIPNFESANEGFAI